MFLILGVLAFLIKLLNCIFEKDDLEVIAAIGVRVLSDKDRKREEWIKMRGC